MGQHQIMGILVIFIGVAILLNIIGLASLLLGPLILLAIALFFIKRKHPIIGIIVAVIGASVFIKHVLHFNIISLAISLVFVYAGIKLLIGQGKERRRKPSSKTQKENLDLHFDEEESDQSDEELDKTKKEKNKKSRKSEKDAQYDAIGSTVRSSFIGDYHLMGRQFELEDLTIRNGIGDVKIDLTKAIIPEGETVIVVQAWIGDVDIFVPYDLDLSVSASVTIGDLNILSEKQGGFGRQVTIKTKDYESSSRRVRLILSLLIGDIDVRVL
ncbi:cell wall-active antibiotics response protein LiaF [Pullulanibacillus sp. KACC 23026]|uniref:cell wall-active antibiotics response protein LiaF n=1 Tax=Pullulanibacillus sp. KACC 23026 TaxID=3028315 RepID=UPI0023AF058A|nr:cell wall-active antibiotics response protein LiaF [Pullulanibacillus sp. KACC 23026]WEG13027.1 cell wall-active antibiotics response protein LiaF [Pullulanibacillus sp. KACC 23026]